MEPINQTVFIHYGAESFNPDLVKPIENNFVKPKGGLWASPINSKWGWKDWCEYDAVWLTEKGLNETHFSFPKRLYGWDCESILIMNAKIVVA